MAINYQRIGERMKTIREIKNISVGTMADKTNFTAKSILLAENGKASLSLEFLLAICSSLDITPNDLLLGEYESTDSALREVETLLDDLVLRMNDAKRQDVGGNRTQINDTDETIQAIRRKLVEYRKEPSDSRSSSKPSTMYYR